MGTMRSPWNSSGRNTRTSRAPEGGPSLRPEFAIRGLSKKTAVRSLVSAGKRTRSAARQELGGFTRAPPSFSRAREDHISKDFFSASISRTTAHNGLISSRPDRLAPRASMPDCKDSRRANGTDASPVAERRFYGASVFSEALGESGPGRTLVSDADHQITGGCVARAAARNARGAPSESAARGAWAFSSLVQGYENKRARTLPGSRISVFVPSAGGRFARLLVSGDPTGIAALPHA